MRIVGLLGICFALAAASVRTHAAEVEKWIAEGGCPAIEHVPIVQVVRGTPAIITAKIECPGGQLTEVLLQIRLTDVGKATSEIKMTGKGDGLFQATVPVSMVQGITRFWYYIDTKGKTASGEESILQTGWKVVNIIQHGVLNQGTGGAAGALGGSSGGGNAGWYWLAGGAAVVGGAVAIENNGGSGGGGGGEDKVPAQPGGEIPKKGESETPCTQTGDGEAALIGITSPCAEVGYLDVAVCGFCPGAVVQVVGSWGAVRQRTFEKEIPCNPSQVPVIRLPRPDGTPTGPESETIYVLINGALIEQWKWPSYDEYFDCYLVD